MPHIHIGLPVIVVTVAATVGIVWLCKRDWKKTRPLSVSDYVATSQLYVEPAPFVAPRSTSYYPQSNPTPNSYRPVGAPHYAPPIPHYGSSPLSYYPPAVVNNSNNNGMSFVEGMVAGAVLDEVLTDHHHDNYSDHSYNSQPAVDNSQSYTDNGSFDSGSSSSSDSGISWDSGSSSSSDSSSGIDVSW